MLKILGCSVSQLKLHFENYFKEGMNWDNYGSHWHVDHHKPLYFAKTIEQVEKLNHYSNLRPLWGEENLKKSNKLVF